FSCRRGATSVRGPPWPVNGFAHSLQQRNHLAVVSLSKARSTGPVLAPRALPQLAGHYACCVLRIDRRLGQSRPQTRPPCLRSLALCPRQGPMQCPTLILTAPASLSSKINP